MQDINKTNKISQDLLNFVNSNSNSNVNKNDYVNNKLDLLLKSIDQNFSNSFVLKIDNEKPNNILRHNVVDISCKCSIKYNLKNNQIIYLFNNKDFDLFQATIHINDKITDDSLIRIPNLLKEMFLDNVFLLIPNDFVASNVLPQNSSLLKEDVISINSNIYGEMIKRGVYYVDFRHLATGATLTRPISLIKSDDRLKTNQIKMNYYQRSILNVYDKNISSSYGNDKYVDFLKEKVKRTNCKNDIDNSYIELKDSDDYNSIQMVCIFDDYKNNKSVLFKIIDFFVGKQELKLSAVRPYKIDDTRNVIRLSKNNMTLLGIGDADRVVIKYKNKKYYSIALSIDNYESMKETNILNDESSLDLIVGVPVPIRKELNINDLETEIIVERDTSFLFKKNFDIQLLSILGYLVTIIQFDISPMIRILLSIVLIPLVLWISLSKERSKVLKFKRK